MKKILFITLMFLLSCAALREAQPQFEELTYPDDLNIVKRADWGWVPIDSTFKTHTIRYITVHHAGVEFKDNED